jgi:hypothetical protein
VRCELAETEKHYKCISVALVELALGLPHVDAAGESMMNDVVDAALDWIELALESALVSMWELEDWGVEHLVGVGTADHELRKANEKALGILRVVGIAVVVLEDLEAAGMWDSEEFEVWIELC